MRKTLNLILILILLSSLVAAEPSEKETAAGLTPDNPFYFTEQIVESLEVKLAGLIGGEDLKARAIANNADERLAEAQKMDSNNKTVQAERLKEKYRKQINRSKKVAKRSNNPNTMAEIGELSKRNTEVLKKKKNRTPPQAKKSIGKFLNASNGTVGNSQKNVPNKDKQDSNNPDRTEKSQNKFDEVANNSINVENRTDEFTNSTNSLKKNISSDADQDSLNRTQGMENSTKDIENSSIQSTLNETLENSSESITGNTVVKPSDSENLSNSSKGPVDETTDSTGLN